MVPVDESDDEVAWTEAGTTSGWDRDWDGLPREQVVTVDVV